MNNLKRGDKVIWHRRIPYDYRTRRFAVSIPATVVEIDGFAVLCDVAYKNGPAQEWLMQDWLHYPPKDRKQVST